MNFNLTSIYDTDICVLYYLSIEDLINLLTLNKYLYCTIKNYSKFIEYDMCFGTCNTYTLNITKKVQRPSMLFAKACMYGNLEYVKWIYSKYTKPILYIHMAIIFADICSVNNIDMIKWLVDDIGINMKLLLIGFEKACYGNHILTASLLLNKIGANTMTFTFIENILNKIFTDGKKCIAEWFLHNFKNYIRCDSIKELFVKMCIKNKYDFVLLIYKFYGNDFDREKSSTMKYGSAISTLDRAFKSCSSNNCMDVAQWLCIINNDFRIVIKNNKIYGFEILSG
jgi:hypothetical protein